jgi:hypothetical protein
LSPKVNIVEVPVIRDHRHRNLNSRRHAEENEMGHAWPVGNCDRECSDLSSDEFPQIIDPPLVKITDETMPCDNNGATQREAKIGARHVI